MSNWTTGPSNGQDDTSPQSRDIAQADSGYDTIAPSKAAGHSSSSTAEADNAADVGKPLGASRSTQITARDALFREEFDVSHRGSAVLDHPPRPLSRGGTLKKKPSLSRKTSLKRGGSRRSSRAGSVRSVFLGDKEKYSVEGDGGERNSAFYTPVPTAGNPTEILATRFQAWRKVLKDLVAYFREIQNSYETRSKALLKVSNVVNNTGMPAVFLAEGKGGISDAALILRDFHKRSISECQKAKDIENDVIIQLNGLRSDLNLKIKEIKNLSSDFKNSVEKEMNVTRKAVHGLQEALGLVDTDPHATTGKGDPFIVKLGVDKQLEKQIDEENYLHRAFLNLEGSGRELESIVIGEIQKAYSALASILRREADEEYDTVEKLRAGPLGLPKDHEWISFVQRDDRFVDPRLPIRSVEEIVYPGKYHPAAAEVRAGMLERKSKYLKSYTAGWYILSSTHLHEFKSAERINVQTPVMSLYLPEQKLGTHSHPESSSHKFMLKGRQTGAMHRGHSWVFRAESHDTMLAWYEDMRDLTEKSGEERNTYVRRHARSMSAESQKAGSISSDGAMEEDEADEIPYSATASSINQAPLQDQVKRPQPGGRFPSDFQVDRGLQATHSASSASSYIDGDLNPRIQPVSKMGASNSPGEDDQNIEPRGDIDEKHTIDFATVATSPYSITSRTQEPTEDVTRLSVEGPRTIEPPKTTSSRGQFRQNSMQGSAFEGQKHDSLYGDWMAPVHQTGGQPIAGSQRFVQSDGSRSDTAEARSSRQVGQPLDGEGIPPHEEKSTGASVPVKATSESIIPGFPTPDEPKTTQLGSMFGSNDEQQLSQDSGADPVVTDGPDKTTTTSAAKRPGPAHKSSSYYKVPGDFPSTGERTLKIDK